MSPEESDLKALESGWAGLGVLVDASISIDTYGRKNLHLSRLIVGMGAAALYFRRRDSYA